MSLFLHFRAAVYPTLVHTSPGTHMDPGWLSLCYLTIRLCLWYLGKCFLRCAGLHQGPHINIRKPSGVSSPSQLSGIIFINIWFLLCSFSKLYSHPAFIFLLYSLHICAVMGILATLGNWVSSGCFNKLLWMKHSKKEMYLFPQLKSLRSTRSRDCKIQRLLRACFLVRRWLFPCCAHEQHAPS